MLYVCYVCRFTFNRIGEPESCPDCGKLALREATDEERVEFLKNQAMLNKDKN